MHPKTRNRPSDSECRVLIVPIRIEQRADGSGPGLIVGHAAVFDQWTTLYEGQYWTWREVVRPGAFRNALLEKQDVIACVNHDGSQLLARTSSGTLKLSEDATGLLAEINPPDTQLGRDTSILVARRDFVGMSFAFRVRPNGDRTTITQQGDMELEERELLDVDLSDVSIVTCPAYPQTDVSVRSKAAHRDKPHRDPWLDRARVRLRLAEAER